MPDDISQASPSSSTLRWLYHLLAAVVLGLRAWAVTRLVLHYGPRDAPGYNRPKKFAICPKCHKRVRVEADGWCNCRNCGHEFEFKGK